MNNQDLRVQKTLNSIHVNFFKLLEKKALKKITIKELSELSKINKGTFYLHYKDIYDLYEFVVNQFLEDTIERLNFNFLFNHKSIKFLYDFHEETKKTMNKMKILYQEEYKEFVEDAFLIKLTKKCFETQEIVHNELNSMKIEIIFKNILYLLPKTDAYGQEKLFSVLSQLIDLIVLQIKETDVNVQ